MDGEKAMKNRLKTLKIQIFCLLAAGLMCLNVEAQTQNHHFWINEHVAVSGNIITFGHIAEPRSDAGRKSWSEVRDIQLWRAPESGQRIVLSRAQVLDRLSAVNMDLAGQSVVPREIIFQRGAKVYSENELISMVKQYLKPRMQGMGDEVKFRDFRVPAPVFLESVYEKIEIETASDPAPGRISLRINLVDAHGAVSRRLTGNVFADVWVTVACATRPLNRGDIVEPGDVRFERKNLAYLRNDVWDGKSGPWRVRSSIGQGQPILQRALEAVPVVSRGDHVSLVFQSANVTLSVPVQVLEDGQRGDSIMVRNLNTRKEISGIVQDGGTVIVR